jgi:hypothetical protein
MNRRAICRCATLDLLTASGKSQISSAAATIADAERIALDSDATRETSSHETHSAKFGLRNALADVSHFLFTVVACQRLQAVPWCLEPHSCRCRHRTGPRQCQRCSVERRFYGWQCFRLACLRCRILLGRNPVGTSSCNSVRPTEDHEPSRLRLSNFRLPTAAVSCDGIVTSRECPSRESSCNHSGSSGSRRQHDPLKRAVLQLEYDKSVVRPHTPLGGSDASERVSLSSLI